MEKKLFRWRLEFTDRYRGAHHTTGGLVFAENICDAQKKVLDWAKDVNICDLTLEEEKNTDGVIEF